MMLPRKSEECSEKENDAREQHESFELKLRDIDKEIETVLKRGDQEELAAQLATTDRQIQAGHWSNPQS